MAGVQHAHDEDDETRDFNRCDDPDVLLPQILGAHFCDILCGFFSRKNVEFALIYINKPS